MPFIEEHRDIIPCDDRTILWRYMDIPTFLNLLTNRELVFVRSDLFEDKFEGRIPPLMAAALNRGIEDFQKTKGPVIGITEDFAKLFEDNTKISSYISCWIKSEHQHVHMWKLYSKINGIAVQTDFGSLKDSIATEAKIYASEIEYVDFENNFFPQANSSIKYFLQKKREYSSEQEFRLLIPRPEFDENTGKIIDSKRISDNLIIENPKIFLDRPTISCDIVPEKLIKKIILSPYAPNWYLGFLNNILSAYGINMEVEHASL